MKIINKSILAASALTIFLGSNALYAHHGMHKHCPHIEGYKLSWHNDNYSKCTYMSKHANHDGSTHNNQYCANHFPLNDHHYKLLHCKFKSGKDKCMCTIAKKK